jgi:hypothetical protein
MNTKALENSIRIMDYQLLEDEEQKQNLIDEIFIPVEDIGINFLEPFKTELEMNLLNKESKDGIRIVLKHYIHEFWRAELFFDNHKEILIQNNYVGENSSEYCVPQHWEDFKLSEFELYVIRSYYIFNCHFYYIQDWCTKYQIDFFDLCRELRFKWDMLSTTSAQSYIPSEEWVSLNKDEQKQVNKATKTLRVTSFSIALFCKLVNDSGIMKQGEISNEKFCKAVCSKYNLPYSTRVRINLNGSDTLKNKQKVKELILPGIDEVTWQVITEYLTKKNR